MSAKLRSRLSYSHVMATVAVFIAMGGAAYAITVPRHSVGAEQLKSHAVTSQKIRRNAVSSAKIKDRSLLARDFKSGQLPALGAAQADEIDPASQPSSTIRTTTITTSRAGRIWVVASLRDAFLTCAASSCSATWGLYVDDVPLADSGVRLETVAGESDGYTFYTIFGTSESLRAGQHAVNSPTFASSSSRQAVSSSRSRAARSSTSATLRSNFATTSSSVIALRAWPRGYRS